MSNRILIIGATGSGKTTLSKKIAKILKIKSKSIDDLRYSKDYLIKFPNKEADKKLEKFIRNKNWILDGVYAIDYISPAIKKANLIIVLKSNRIKIIFRIIKREIKFRKENKDKPFLDLIKLLYWSQKFKNHNELRTISLRKIYKRKIILLKNNKEIDGFIESLKNNKA